MTHDPHPLPSNSADPHPETLRQEAARCVACGLCLPHCPTYRKTLNEADSPRGRIFLMAALLEHKLPLSPELVAHLDLCLACRACENACPSQVRYGQLVDGVRALIEPERQRPMRQQALRRVLFRTLAHPRLLQSAGGVLRVYQRSGLQSLARKSRLLEALGLDRAEARLPPLSAPPRSGMHPAHGTTRGTVGLFLGCVARMSDAETLHAAVFVLNRLGYAVQVAPRQTCCGALHELSGERETAQRLAQENRAAFAAPELLAIVHAASGCGATLAEYTPPLAAPVLDISAFLATAQGWEQVELAPLAHNIAVHEPCLSRNVLHDQDAAYALLRRIPAATVAALAGNDQCCGAAGIYALTQPEMAAQLLRDKIDAIKASGAHIIATSNPGCAMHLADGLKAEGWSLEVLHPVTLVARQMGYPK
ncbi:glycolate oxidase iron-sulfur subunit [Sulfurimicrobium lacus]|uniref:Glycolate oxidase iron-sulfur subunit n=1 Tax=Sulfurimicrobium lacus TaxID=2715678 RepID=A0A6F8VI55_9PROT|nr:(Fe-S)-binding protein [Sulfurimicrobium lacus]BCB28622.1 glycolate oxidase iron-sulfur subunit [Sulfurimicrobium lacus]